MPTVVSRVKKVSRKTVQTSLGSVKVTGNVSHLDYRTTYLAGKTKRSGLNHSLQLMGCEKIAA